MTTTNNVEEVSTMNITVGEVSGASLATRVVANHNASDPNQHTISAITDLEGRLSALEALETEREEGNTIKTIYSKGENFANRYKFITTPSDGSPRIGRFVSFNETTEEVDVCTGSDIFGVTVDDAGFIGNYSADQFDEDYVAVVTSGVVDVICDTGVAKGDCVVSDEYGRAKKAIDGCGYRVIDVNDDGEYKLATIMLAVQADKINRLARNIEVLTGRTNTNETNILTAINLASLACAKNGVETDYLKELEDEVRETISSSATNSSSALEIANQAQIAAAGALTNANNMKNDAVAEATNAAIDTILASKEFEEATKEGVSELEDKVTIVEKKVNGSYETVDTINGVAKEETIVYYAEDTKKYHYYDYDNSDWEETTDPRAAGLNVAIAGIQVETDENSSSITQLTSWQGTTNTAMARIEQKADANGAYIQSTVFNMDKYSVGPHSQAYGFTLEQATTVLEEGMIYVPTVNHDEEYEYTDAENNTQTYKRSFERQYLYKWGVVSGEYRWITVDKNYNETSETNTSDKAVYFVTTEPTVGDNFGYWYTEGRSVAEPYKPYTLYKWDSYVDESDATQYQWVQVATLAGNSQSRAVSQVKQTANSIESSVTTLDNKYAGTKTWIDENKSAIQATVTWKNDNAESIATFMQEAGDNFASAAQVAQIVDKDGNIKAASIVTAVAEDESSIALLAEHIALNGVDISLKGQTIKISADDVLGIESPYFSVNTDGKVTATGGEIGGFTLEDKKLYTGNKNSFEKPTDTLHNLGVYVGTDGISVGGALCPNPDLTTYYAGVSLEASTGKLIANNAEITGAITANSGKIGGICIDETNGLFNNSTFEDSQCGILSNSSYIGYGKLTVSSGGLLSPGDWSPIYLFAGQTEELQDGLGQEDVVVKTNTDNCNFYVTQSGFVNAKSLLCDGGVIGIKSDGYDIAMNAGQFIVRGMNDTYNVKNCKTIYALQGITWNDANNNITGRIVANYDTKFMDVSGTWKFRDLEVGSSASSGNVLLTNSEVHVQTNSNMYIDDSSNLHITVAHDDGETTYNVGTALKVSIDKINEIVDKVNEILEDKDFSADKLEQIQ